MYVDEESHYIRKEGCPKCGSSDANAVYSDGHTYCFSCETHQKGEDMGVTKIKRNVPYFTPCLGQPLPLIKRGINQETVTFWDYHVSEYNGKPCQVAFYKDAQRTIVGQKIRFEDKEFICQGDFTESPLFGQHLWRDGGKMVTVVEGEVDALSLSQVFQNKWAVVSIRSGASGAKRDIRDAIDWLEKFDSVIFMFDMDDQGQKASKECSQLLTPSKAKIAQLPLKDANEMLLAGRTKELIDAVWSAKVHRPDCIISGGDLWTAITEQKNVESVPYPFNGLNKMTHGLRRGEIVTITAGSGIGKSQITREIAHSLIHNDVTLGYIALEESVKRSALGLLSLELNKPLHLGTEEVSNDELWRAFSQSLGNNRVYFYDHFGSTDSENLLARLRYLSVGCSCTHVVLDHLSIVVSGMEGGDERRIIDNTMTKLRTLAEELQICIILVSHLKRPSGDRGHEDGAVTSLSQLRGSHAISQLSDIVIGLERNQQDKDNPNLTTVRVLKNRWTGETGIACHLLYSQETGRMTETIFEETEDF